ncbi:MAG: LysM peptidoglycan-binding domain-containing protein [candidate division Zixibacteria bacterium]|nr:LysM peptidoglycan-binding domain-containing protein [candidate division Zixibacteria bacterium]
MGLAITLAVVWFGGCAPTAPTQRVEENQRRATVGSSETSHDPPSHDVGGTADKSPSTDSTEWVIVSLDDTSIEPVEVSSAQEQDINYSTAVDDDLWRQMEMAGEYYSMGLVANQNGGWDEAQYYFERALKLLGELDISEENVSDTTSAEWRKYNGLIANIVASYNVTLLSLGRLPADISPSAMVRRFGDFELQLDSDEITGRLADTVVTYDMPIKFNDRVKASIKYFQTDARDAFLRYWSRSTRYLPMLREIIRSYGLPEDLVYLPMVESGYNAKAYSWARASGLWQFISSTGKLYGLKRSWWYDERRDPIKATHAACKYLKWLYKEFGDWELALAAYNAGPGRVRRTLKRDRATTFWQLRHLKRETRNYVPLFMAATIISKNPEKYGFDRDEVEFQEPLAFDEVVTKKTLDMRTVARALGVRESVLLDLNPELLRKHTPPKASRWKFKVPKGSSDKFQAVYASLKSPQQTSWVKHRIKRGQTISTIAARYGVSQYAIRDANNMGRRSRIYAGKTLIVPVPLDGANSRPPKNRKTSNGIYIVRRGDSVYEIARSFGISMSSLKNLNGIGSKGRIYVGRQLKIPGKTGRQSAALAKTKGPSKTFAKSSSDSSPKSFVTHKVRRGENLTVIARRFGVSVSKLRKWNSLGSAAMIFPGQRLKVYATSGKSDTYTVRRGDSLWKIARRYGISLSKLKAWNDLSSRARISPGQTLYLTSNGRFGSRGYVWHTVRRGENLSLIAGRYNTSVRRLMRDNKIKNASRIRVGLRLKVVN